MPTDPRLAGAIALGIALSAWNVLLAGRIATARGQRPGIVEVSGVCGLLIIPGTIIAVASSWVTLGRTVALLSWVWPLTLLLFVVQSILAAWHRKVSSFVVVPLLLLNVVLLVAGGGRYISTVWPDTPSWLLGVGAAVTSVLGLGLGPAVLGTPLALPLPVLIPVGPSRIPGGRVARWLLATGAAAFVILVILEYPASTRAVTSFARLVDAPLRERPRGDIALGIRIFPVLDRAPTRLAIARDLPLADTLGARVIAVTITPAGSSPAALDSLAGVLSDLRADSIVIVVSLGYDVGERDLARRDPVSLSDRRLAAIEQIVRRVRPDVILPAVDPLTTGREALGAVPLGWWTDHLTRASRLVHSLRPRTQVGVAVAAESAADSVLYRWAAASPDMNLIGWSFAPGFRGGSEIRARQRVASRWMAGATKPHWVTGIRSYPYVFGERGQQYALVGTLAWASANPRVEVVVVDGAGDYDQLTGLQRADGRLRPATAVLAAANRALREAALGRR